MQSRTFIRIVALGIGAAVVLLARATAINADVVAEQQIFANDYLQQYGEDRFGSPECKDRCSGKPCCTITVHAE